MKNAYIRKFEKRYRSVFIGYDGAGKAFLTELAGRNYSERSLESYFFALKDFLLFSAASGIERLQEVTAEDFEGYRRHLEGKNFSGWTVGLRLRTVRSFFGFLEQSGRIFLNPASDLTAGEPARKPVQVPSAKGIRQVLTAPDPGTVTGIRDRAVLEVCYRCALMVKDLAKLDISGVNLERGTLRVPVKGRKGRSVPLEVKTLSALKKYLGGPREALLKGNIDEEALWIDRFGGRMSSQTLNLIFRASSGSTVPPLMMRRARAVHMLEAGIDPVRIQMLFGYSGEKALARYLGMNTTELKRAAERKGLK